MIYKLCVYDRQGWDIPQWCYSFNTVKDKWIDVTIPFTQLKPIYRAKSMQVCFMSIISCNSTTLHQSMCSLCVGRFVVPCLVSCGMIIDNMTSLLVALYVQCHCFLSLYTYMCIIYLYVTTGPASTVYK
jgi:Complex I intermediate-associated protein 30 (CIA30)